MPSSLLLRRPPLRCARHADTTPENAVVSTPEVLPSDELARLFEDGKLGSAVEKLGFLRPLELVDRNAVEAIGRELRRMVKCGNVEEAVDVIGKIAGFHFFLKELVEPFEIIRMCQEAKPKCGPKETSKESDTPAKEVTRTERASVFSKPGHASSFRSKKPTSSVEADIVGSTIGYLAQPKQEASTASSKTYTFRKGDRVKYVGASSSSPLQG